MRADCDDLPVRSTPVFLDRAEEVQTWLRTLSYPETRKLWGASDAIAGPAYEQLQAADLRRRCVPALLSYDGIAYQYLAPGVLEGTALDYLQDHLLILSGLYGALRPFDGVVPYRLEMNQKARVAGTRSLYEYWGDALYRAVMGERVDGHAIAYGRVANLDGAADAGFASRVVVNLASKEYSRVVERYLQPGDRFVTCTFAVEERGRLIQKGVYCKIGRGEMVRYMATHAVEDPDDLVGHDLPGWRFSEEYSHQDELIFLRVPDEKE